MDDIIWWAQSREQAKHSFFLAQQFLTAVGLTIKANIKIEKSHFGVTYCGFRIKPHWVGLSLRRKRRYQLRRLYWERQYAEGRISAKQLQAAYAAVASICQGTDSIQWRKNNLALHPAVEV